MKNINTKTIQRPLLDMSTGLEEIDDLGNLIESGSTKPKSNKETNYYLQQRYLSAEMNTDKISFEPDTTSRMYSDNSQESVQRSDLLKELDLCIRENKKVYKIVKSIPVDKTINLGLIEVNTIYSFCIGLT